MYVLQCYSKRIQDHFAETEDQILLVPKICKCYTIKYLTSLHIYNQQIFHVMGKTQKFCKLLNVHLFFVFTQM